MGISFIRYHRGDRDHKFCQFSRPGGGVEDQRKTTQLVCSHLFMVLTQTIFVLSSARNRLEGDLVATHILAPPLPCSGGRPTFCVEKGE